MPAEADQSHDAAWLRRFRRRLLAWYRANARELPWRNTHDPYAIWVSEIMLQQTQVATVIDYYERFLERFPTVESLATAEEEQVLRLWEGLGYYRRARQLHRAAGVIVSEHDGKFPTDYQQVLALPGIGRYTAGAILSFAFNQKLPIVEANTQRLYCRLLAHDTDPTSSASQGRLWQFAQQLLPAKNAGQLNQALIELGATVCQPRQPQCEACPVMSLCPTFEGNLQEVIPAPKRKMVYEDRHEAALVIYRGEQVLLRKCAVGQRWAGLWDFPRFHLGDVPQRADSQARLTQLLASEFGIEAAIGDHLTTIRHGVTKYRITLDCYTGAWQSGKLPKNHSVEQLWCPLGKLDDYPLSVTGRKISRLIASRH